jgi:hypothetical protein
MELDMRKLFATAALVMALTVPASAGLSISVRIEAPEVSVPVRNAAPGSAFDNAENTTEMLHNGSLVAVKQLFNGGSGRTEITYVKPHAGLTATPGTLLFSGTYNSKRNWYSGVAYVFKKGCEPAPYPVTGTQTGPGIVLVGPAPIRASNSCDVTGYVTPRNKSWWLAFEVQEVD